MKSNRQCAGASRCRFRSASKFIACSGETHFRSSAIHYYAGPLNGQNRTLTLAPPQGITRLREFDVDRNRLAAVPLTEALQTIGEIFESGVFRQQKRERAIGERHRHPALLPFVMM